MKNITINEKNIKRYDALNIARFIAALLVVAIHTSPIEGNLGYLLCNVIARVAVPFFFVTSGYFFYIKFKENNGYKKIYIKKLVVLYTVWYILYFILRGVSIGLFIIGILGDSYSGLVENSIINSIIYLYKIIFGTTKSGVCFAVPFLTIGILISKYEINNKIKHNNLLLLIGGILLIIEAFILKYYKVGVGRNIYISLLIVAPLLLIKLINSKTRIDKNISKLCRELSVGVYCLHGMIIIIVNKFFSLTRINCSNENLIKFCIVSYCSIILSYMIYKSNNRYLKLLL